MSEIWRGVHLEEEGMWHRQEGGRGCADRRNVVRMEWALDWISRCYQFIEGSGSWKAGH